MKTKQLIASAAAAATLAAGGLTVAAVNPLAGAGAAESSTTTTTSATPAPDAGRAGRGHVLEGVLDGLVAKGTLTRAQADAVLAAVKAKVGEHPRGDHGGHRRQRREEIVATAAKAIGISAKDLAAALKDGKSIADVAKAKGVDPKAVVQALVKAATAKIDQAVANGTITAEKAAKAKAHLPEFMAKVVEHAPKR